MEEDRVFYKYAHSKQNCPDFRTESYSNIQLVLLSSESLQGSMEEIFFYYIFPFTRGIVVSVRSDLNHYSSQLKKSYNG